MDAGGEEVKKSEVVIGDSDRKQARWRIDHTGAGPMEFPEEAKTPIALPNR